MGTGTDVTPKSLTFGGHIIITCPAGSMHRMGVETSSELQFLAKPVRLRNHCTQRFLIIVLCIPKLNVWKGSAHADLKITLILNNSNALCHTISCHTVKHQNHQTPARKKSGYRFFFFDTRSQTSLSIGQYLFLWLSTFQVQE